MVAFSKNFRDQSTASSDSEDEKRPSSIISISSSTPFGSAESIEQPIPRLNPIDPNPSPQPDISEKIQNLNDKIANEKAFISSMASLNSIPDATIIPIGIKVRVTVTTANNPNDFHVLVPKIVITVRNFF